MFYSFINCRDYFTLLFVLGCCHFEGTRTVSGVLFSAQLPPPSPGKQTKTFTREFSFEFARL